MTFSFANENLLVQADLSEPSNMAAGTSTFRQIPFPQMCILKAFQRKGIEVHMRKIIWLLCLAACLLVATPVAAAEYRGSIQLKLEAGDLAVTNGTVTLYQVGTRVEEGYRITEDFGGGIVRREDADSDKLAQWLAETADANGTSLLLDADGNAVFSDLQEGLYMLVQTQRMDGFYPIHPILLTIPKEDSWHVQIVREPVPIVTEIPQTGQSPIPFLGILGMLFSSIGLLLCVRKNKKS